MSERNLTPGILPPRILPPRIFMMDMLATVPYYTAYLTKALRAAGANVTLGSITYDLDPECFSSRGLKVEPGLLDVVGRRRLPRLPRRALKLLETALNLTALTARFAISPPEIVHVQYLPMLRWRLPLDLRFVEFCRRRGSKIVLTVHDLLPHDSGEAYRRTFARLYRKVDGIVCHSEPIRGRLREEFGISGEKIFVIPHGPFFHDLPPAGCAPELPGPQAADAGPLLVLWQGILFPYKGVDLLLNAWQRVEASGVNASLTIAGTGAPELLEQIREQVRRLGLRRVELRFRFLAAQELVALYRAADIVVYPYRAITTSGALATGLALGKTIVASDLPVFRELLTHGETAVLVDPQNSAELAGALLDLANDAGKRQQLAAGVQAMNFGDQSWISIAGRTMEVYRTVLEWPA